MQNFRARLNRLAGPNTIEVLRLSLCQTLMTIGNITVVFGVAIGAKTMLPPEQWAHVGIPIGLQFACQALTTFPAAQLMSRIGRRSGFMLGAAIGVCGAASITLAFFLQQFWLLCVGGALHGVYTGFAFQYRFAAVELAEGKDRPKAISLVVAGGILAALCAPSLALFGVDLFEGARYAGSFMFVTCAGLIALALLSCLRIEKPLKLDRPVATTPYRTIFSRPRILVALFAATASYGLMNLLMTMTPLAMSEAGHDLEHIAGVIRIHVLGMFVPSLFTGWLIARFGVDRILVGGAFLMVLCLTITLSGVSVMQFWFGLLALGMGWNWLFVGGTSLLSDSHTASERGRVQGINELCVFGFTTLSAFSFGYLHAQLGWHNANWLAAPLVTAMVVISCVFAFYSSKRLSPTN